MIMPLVCWLILIDADTVQVLQPTWFLILPVLCPVWFAALIQVICVKI